MINDGFDELSFHIGIVYFGVATPTTLASGISETFYFIFIFSSQCWKYYTEKLNNCVLFTG